MQDQLDCFLHEYRVAKDHDPIILSTNTYSSPLYGIHPSIFFPVLLIVYHYRICQIFMLYSCKRKSLKLFTIRATRKNPSCGLFPVSEIHCFAIKVKIYPGFKWIDPSITIHSTCYITKNNLFFLLMLYCQ